MVTITFRPIIPSGKAILDAVKLVKDLQEYEDRWAKKVIATAQKYPAPPPGSKYVRTNKFRDEWKEDPPRFEGGNLIVRIRNEATDRKGRRYGGYVMGDVRAQASVHKGRWKELKDVAKQDDFQNGAQKVITDALR